MKSHRQGIASPLRYLQAMVLLTVVLVVVLACAPEASASSSVTLSPGWNLVAGGPGTAFPSVLFGWDGASYGSTTTPAAWGGYWCKVTEQQVVSLSTVDGPHTTALTTGWNLIGNPMSSTASLTLPSGGVAFVYDSSTGTYVSTTTLAPGSGAWVKATAGETVPISQVPAPTITSITPWYGSTDGGMHVYIHGTGFSDETKVKFGNVTATDVQVMSSQLLIAVAPPQAAGTVALSVTTSEGISAETSVAEYTYGDPTALEVRPSDLSLVVGGVTGDQLQLALNTSAVLTATTQPATVKVGIGCGCVEGDCCDTDIWGCCHTFGYDVITPAISIVKQSDPSIATVTADPQNPGRLTAEGVGSGTTTVVLEAEFQGVTNAGGLQGFPMVTVPETVTITVGG